MKNPKACGIYFEHRFVKLFLFQLHIKLYEFQSSLKMYLLLWIMGIKLKTTDFTGKSDLCTCE